MIKSSSQLILTQNKSKILNAIRDNGPLSRTELTRLTNISPPTVTRIVNILIKERLVRDIGIGASNGGRPPIILEFDAESCVVVGIEWGLTQLKGIIANLNGVILFERVIAIGTDNNIEHELEEVCDLVRYLLGSALISPERLKGIGIAAAGYINKKTGTIEYSPVQKWQNINIKKPIKELFHVPVFIDYLSRVMSLSEHLYGCAKDIKDYIFITIDYGLGAGILLEGLTVKGFDGFSGEIGHILVTPPPGYKDRVCVCGKKNCLATFASGRGIVQTLKTDLQNRLPEAESLIADFSTNDFTADLIIGAAENGNSYCRRIVSEAGYLLGVAIANISLMLNPEAVILGGHLMGSELFFQEISSNFYTNCLRGSSRSISLLKSNIIDQAAVKGAAALVLESILRVK